MKTLTIAGTTTVETTVTEFVAFVMETKEMTHVVLDAELTRLEVSFAKSWNKEKKAVALFEALEAMAPAEPQCNLVEPIHYDDASGEYVTQSATSETPVAENKSEEEIKMEQERKEMLARNERAWANSPMLRQNAGKIYEATKHEYVNPISVKVNQQLNEAVTRFYSRLGEYAVTILRVVPVQNDPFGRIGFIDVSLPMNYAAIGIWNDTEKTKEWFDFADFNYNQMVKRQKWSAPYTAAGMIHNLEFGSGIVRLAIREDANGEVYVRLPMDKDDKVEGRYWDVFRTSDIRWSKPNSKNNSILESRITAMLRFYWSELKIANPQNRTEFDASCMNCANMQWFRMKDGVDDDMEAKNPKSTAILNQPNVEELAQNGSVIRQAWCTAKKEWVDGPAVDLINKLTQEERREYQTEVIDRVTGETRLEYKWQGRDEVLYQGKPIKTRDIRVEMTRSTCAGCPFYRRNQFKGENMIGNEKVEAREQLLSKAKNDSEKAAIRETKAFKTPYIDSYWTSRAQADAEAFETLLTRGDKTVWVPGLPADVAKAGDTVNNIRVMGQGGVTVYLSDEMLLGMNQSDFLFVPTVKEFKEEEAAFNKQVNMIFFAAFNRDKMSKDNYELVATMIYVDGKPDGITERQAERWDNAVYWFEQSIEWAKQRIAAQNRPAFTDKFFNGLEGYIAAKGLEVSPEELDLQAMGVREIHVEDVMQETLARVEDEAFSGEWYRGMFEAYGLQKGYEDLAPEDFIRFLDDAARDYVIDSLLTGEEFVVVGGIKGFERTEEEELAREVFGARRNIELEDFSRDRELVAGALQILLGREVNGLLYGINRAEDKFAAFDELNVAEDVLEYLAVHSGLLKK